MVVGNFAKELDLVVIGSGPGGYVAAIRAAQLGKKVAIIERDAIGGVCLNVGCIPSKVLIHAAHHFVDIKSEKYGVVAKEVVFDLEKTQKWKDEEVISKLTKGVESLLKKNKVEIIKGSAFFNDPHQLRVVIEDEAQSYQFKEAIIATGSRPLEIGGFPFKGRVLDSTGALKLKILPKHFVVIGGGYIGCQLASVFANVGSKVTIIEAADNLLMGFEDDMVDLVKKQFSLKNVDVITKAKAKVAVETENSVQITYIIEGEEKSIEADVVMVSVGRVPNTDDLGLQMAGVEVDKRGFIKVDEQGRTSQSHIFAIGDVTLGAALAHKASYEAKIAAAALAGQNVKIDYVAMPAVCSADPELAIVGLSKKQAEEEGIEVNVSLFPFGASGTAISFGETEGFVRIITEKHTGLILGGQVAGIGAGAIIAELALAIESRLNVEDIALTIHAHPTMSEALLDVADVALGLPIHI
ncbi:MAG: dihydrolipoyl dehydrogenase [Erysipelotrichaceae bacterium]|nr:dihydrolipoyl dehydrogenase [Erysipelotrichaceae bacterium]